MVSFLAIKIKRLLSSQAYQIIQSALASHPASFTVSKAVGKRRLLTDRCLLLFLFLFSRAVIPLDPQWIPDLHHTGQATFCLPDNRQPLYLEGGLLGQRKLLLHHLKPVYFQECLLQLHPPRASDWTLVPRFLLLVVYLLLLLTLIVAKVVVTDFWVLQLNRKHK